uniref:Uncharacterized protein n=1 Tax=Anguilla anguilla TaxID=7936 RepID=A0A0E9QZN3_ANGAN
MVSGTKGNKIKRINTNKRTN